MTHIIFFLFLLSSAAGFFFAITHFTHMFQLNSYKPFFQLKWLKKNIKVNILNSLPPIISILFLLFLSGGLPLIAATFLNILYIFLYLPKKAKKPLVFTMRVIRLYITSALIFALISLAATLLYTDYPYTAIILPILLILTFFILLLANLINRPLEKAVRRHYINEAKKKIASLPRLTVIGITGSYGKTSTKYYLYKLLSAKFNVLMTPESYNTTMGVVKTVRESLNAAHDIFICEMGARNIGEIKEICNIVKPKHGIITSIGPCHLETFKTIENVLSTKFELCESLPDDGIIFLNADNDYIRNKKVNNNAVYYSVHEGHASYFAKNISVSESGTTFDFCCDSITQTYTTKLLGKHNVLNLVGCLAVASRLGIDLPELILPIKRLECAPHRLQLINGGNFVIIDDSFNSNPDGTKAALEVLSGFDGEKILITPGMVELGNKQDELNFEFGKNASKICDYVFLVGKIQTRSIYNGLLSEKFPQDKIQVFEMVEKAIEKAKAIMSDEKKYILLENDLPDNF